MLPISRLNIDVDFLEQDSQESLAEEQLNDVSNEEDIGDRVLAINNQSLSSLSDISEEEEKQIQTVKIVKPSDSFICNCKPRIMIVDDNDYNIQAIEMQLEEFWGLEADKAQNGEMAVQMFKEGFQKSCKCANRHYRLIFMDIEMPIMNGIEATEKIQEILKNEKLKES